MVFKICPGRDYEKLKKQFRDTQRVPFMLDKTRKPLFPQLEMNFFEKKTFSENIVLCRKPYAVLYAHKTFRF